MTARKSRARRGNRPVVAARAALAGPLRTSLVTVLLAALPALTLTLTLAPRAEAFVYWPAATGGNEYTIARADLDGTGVERRFITGTGLFSAPSGVAVDAEHVYWADPGSGPNGTIGRANLDGTGVEPNFITGAEFPLGVAVDAGHVYWAGSGGGTAIGRANLDGTDVDPRFITLAAGSFAVGVAVDAEHVYWINNSATPTIGRANLDGTGVDPSFIAGAGFITPAVSSQGIAVDAAHIYWANPRTLIPGPAGTIGRANVDGTGVEPSFITGTGSPCGVAVDAAHVYWTHGPKVGRANLDGTDVDRRFIPERIGGGACGMAVDALRSFRFAEAKKTTRSGRARLRVKQWKAKVTLRLPAPGKLELGRTRSVKAAKKRARAKGTVKLPVSPRGKAKHRLTVGSRCLHFPPRFRCSPDGIVGADVKVYVTYTPRGGGDPNIVASTRSEGVTLVRRCRGC